MSVNFDVIVIFSICDQFGAIRKPDTDNNTDIFINNNFLSYRNWKQNWTNSNAAFILLLWVKVLFSQKIQFFWKKILTSAN